MAEPMTERMKWCIRYVESKGRELLELEKRIKEIRSDKEFQLAFAYLQNMKTNGRLIEAPSHFNEYRTVINNDYRHKRRGRPRKLEEEIKRERAEYQHNYYMKVTKQKRAEKRKCSVNEEI